MGLFTRTKFANWLNCYTKGNKMGKIEMKLSKVVRMWRRNGVFVFDVYQGEVEF